MKHLATVLWVGMAAVAPVATAHYLKLNKVEDNFIEFWYNSSSPDYDRNWVGIWEYGKEPSSDNEAKLYSFVETQSGVMSFSPHSNGLETGNYLGYFLKNETYEQLAHSEVFKYTSPNDE